MTKETIREHYADRPRLYLDNEFEYYCTCDDYYQSVVGDFVKDKNAVEIWCEENGFELLECKGEKRQLDKRLAKHNKYTTQKRLQT